MQKLLTTLQKFIPITDDLELYLRKTVRRDQYKKGHKLVRTGQICERLYFIEQGMLRLYVKHNNKEYSNWFMLEGDIATSVTSFFDQSRSLEIMEVIKDCILLSISGEQLEEAYTKFPDFRKAGQRIMERYYAQDNRQKIHLMTKEADEFYQYMVETHPRMVEELSDKQLADYMGITPQHLSRIKKDIREKGIIFKP
ncbi:MAG: Crp/Fnr family transcriptional regulator [Bacteroidetes bacterium]|nr:Crp/Fnr family transcriptional regulator [Bacteroidota bacterium]